MHSFLNNDKLSEKDELLRLISINCTTGRGELFEVLLRDTNHCGNIEVNLDELKQWINNKINEGVIKIESKVDWNDRFNG